MKIALLGHGAMGQLIAALAQNAGDEIGETITSEHASETIGELVARLTGHAVAIDFSVGTTVARHVEACMRAGVPLVQGTTGWKEHEEQVKQLVVEHAGAMVFGANFSIGVNVFYRIVARAAGLFATLDQYQPFIEEQHHARKKDAPSGTALKLESLLANHLDGPISIASTRAGHIPGTHRVGFDSAADQITLTHAARSREGFAAGALLAARWIIGRQGVFEFSDVIDEILKTDE
jgi:4-hydroxy-tetrahydrodipicolinate reductase